MMRIWQSPFVRLVAYYVLLSVAVWLLIRAFPQIVDLFDAFQKLSPIHGSGGKKDALEQAASTPGVASLGSANLALITFFSMLGADRKSTRLNSSHTVISYAVFCLKKK